MNIYECGSDFRQIDSTDITDVTSYEISIMDQMQKLWNKKKLAHVSDQYLIAAKFNGTDSTMKI